MDLDRTARRLGAELARLHFGPPVSHVYDPTRYAAAVHESYLRTWARPGVAAVLLGMNPGPWGMVQTGVPFGEVALVRDWLRLEGAVGKPRPEHPRRPVDGFSCARSEVSGRRLWSWARDRFGTPEAFFARFFVLNYCPLCLLEASGRNLTPEQLPAAEREPLEEACDRALRDAVRWLRPRFVIGVGRYAARRAATALARAEDPAVGAILHPSPASPAANRGWAAVAERQLAALLGPELLRPCAV